jgi:biofilm PGA synthesis N-glycosyltransferase PgaC
MNVLAASLFGLLMATVLGCAFWDSRKRRVCRSGVSVSVIVPCYNDGATVESAVRSIFASYPIPLLEVIAINDCSTDDSLARIEALAREFPIRVVNNLLNIGKVASLNEAIGLARHDWVLCLDADTRLSVDALGDMLARMDGPGKVAAVSCPYRPLNRGFLPSMQSIEYSMIRLAQGAGNVTSVLALWGGCMMMRRDAYEQVGGFSLNAITEDVDIAYRFNRADWKVEQSFVFVDTLVPDTWPQWFKQKRRWTAGGFQCLLSYPSVWLRNPLQSMFVITYGLLTLSSLFGLLADTSLFHIGHHMADLVASDVPWEGIWSTMDFYYGEALVLKMLLGVGFSMFSLIYVIPLISRVEDVVRIVLIVPFSMGYFPLYVVVSLLGFLFWFFSLRTMKQDQRAW